jgi:hypothetical protein
VIETWSIPQVCLMNSLGDGDFFGGADNLMESLGLHQLRGVAEPLKLFRVVSWRTDRERPVRGLIGAAVAPIESLSTDRESGGNMPTSLDRQS